MILIALAEEQWKPRKQIYTHLDFSEWGDIAFFECSKAQIVCLKTAILIIIVFIVILAITS